METFHTKTPDVSHLTAGIAKLGCDDETDKKCCDGGKSSLNALPVVGHVKGVGHNVCGVIDGGNKAIVDATSTTSNIADGIPVVGPIKRLGHYVSRDEAGGKKAKATTRTTAVMGAGTGGFLVADAGAGWDMTNASVTDGKEVNGIAKIIDNPKSVDSYFDAGVAGYSGGKMAKKIVRRVVNKAARRNAKMATGGEAGAATAPQLVADYDASKITFGECQQKCNDMKSKGGFDNVPVEENADQLQSYDDKRIITERQCNQALTEMAKSGDEKANVNVPPHQVPNSNDASGNQPPQQPIENNRPNMKSRVQELREQLIKIFNDVLKYMNDGKCSPEDRRFQRESFHLIYEIVSELFSNGHTAYIRTNSYNELVIFSLYDKWFVEIEYQLAYFLDANYQLIVQQFPINPESSCPTVLSAEFQGSQLDLSVTGDRHKHITNAIYGIRCRLCDLRIGPRNVYYVGQTLQTVHKRVCGQHKNAVVTKINKPNKRRNTQTKRAKVPYRPMYEHAAGHLTKGDVPPDTQHRDVFRQSLDVILLPTGSEGDKITKRNKKKKRAVLRSWECFWQFFMCCRTFFMAWSQC